MMSFDKRMTFDVKACMLPKECSMKTVLAIYTAPLLVEPVQWLLKKTMPEVRMINIMDDSLIRDVISAGRMTKEVLRRIYNYCLIGEQLGVDAVFQTCSSVGRSVRLIQPFLEFPIYRIDTAMAIEAVSTGTRIGVMATLKTTLEPSCELIAVEAEARGVEVEVVNGLAEGAFDAISAGDAEAHDAVILKKAEELKGKCDVIVLAQGSMARMSDKLAAVAGVRVLSSLESGVAYLKQELGV
jgi:Asp/Glu/hydantoin racemase